MPRRCTVCTHPEREIIETEWLAGTVTLRDAEERWGPSRMSFKRHMDDHLPASLMQAQQAEEVSHADDLLSRILGIESRLTKLAIGAKKESDQIRANRELLATVRLLAELRGELQRHTEITTRHYIDVGAKLLALFEPYPQLKLRAVRVLEEERAKRERQNEALRAAGISPDGSFLGYPTGGGGDSGSGLGQ